MIYYSTDGNNFQYTDFQSLREALWDEGKLTVGTAYYSTDVIPLDPKTLVDVSRITEDLNESLYEEVGDVADNDFGTAESLADLQTVLEAWMDRHPIQQYYVCSGPTFEHKISEEDI